MHDVVVELQGVGYADDEVGEGLGDGDGRGEEAEEDAEVRAVVGLVGAVGGGLHAAVAVEDPRRGVGA